MIIETLKTVARGGKGLVKNKSMTRVSLEKSSKIYVPILGIIAAGMLLLDSFSTYRSNK
jgi:hypothetical protein